MKKSKFLKKSLAMLLALMLVVAMIPLSAAAAAPDVTQINVTADGVAVTLDGDLESGYTGTIPNTASELDLQVLTAPGAAVYYVNDVTAAASQEVSLTEVRTDVWETAQGINIHNFSSGTDTFTVVVRVYDENDKNDPDSYTITLTREEVNVENAIETLILQTIPRQGETAVPQLGYSVLNENTVSITMPYGSGNAYTVKTLETAGATVEYAAPGSNAFNTLVVGGNNPTPVADEGRIRITAGTFSRTYILDITVASGFKSFETEEGLDAIVFPEDGKIAVLLPYGYTNDNTQEDVDDNEYIEVTPVFELDYPSATAAWDVDDAKYSTYDVATDVTSGSPIEVPIGNVYGRNDYWQNRSNLHDTFRSYDGNDLNQDFDWTARKAAADNDFVAFVNGTKYIGDESAGNLTLEYVEGTDRTYDVYFFETQLNNEAAIEELTIGSETAEIDGNNINITLPVGVDASSIDLTADETKLGIVASGNADIVFPAQDGVVVDDTDNALAHTSTETFEVENRSANLNASNTVILRVISEDGQTVTNYNLNVTVSDNYQAPDITSMNLVGPDGEPVPVERDGNIYTFTVPYSVTSVDELAKYKLFYGKTVGSVITTADGTAFPKSGAYVDANGSNSVADETYIPRPGSTNMGTAIVVTSNRGNSQEQDEFFIVINRAEGSTEVGLDDFTIVNTDVTTGDYEDVTETYSATKDGTALTVNIWWTGYETWKGKNARYGCTYATTDPNAKLYWLMGDTLTRVYPVVEDKDVEINNDPTGWNYNSDDDIDGLVVLSEKAYVDFGKNDTLSWTAVQNSGTTGYRRYSLNFNQLKAEQMTNLHSITLLDDSGWSEDLPLDVTNNYISGTVPYAFTSGSSPDSEVKIYLAYNDEDNARVLSWDNVTGGTAKVDQTNMDRLYGVIPNAQAVFDNNGGVADYDDYSGGYLILRRDDTPVNHNEVTVEVYKADGTPVVDSTNQLLITNEDACFGGSGEFNGYTFDLNYDEPNTEAIFTSFSVGGERGVIDQKNHTITVTLPYGTEYTYLVPTYDVSDYATVTVDDPALNGKYLRSGVTSVNFTSPRQFTVHAENEDHYTTYDVIIKVGERFSDVNPGDWFYENVMNAAAKGYVSGMGDGIFQPNGNTTRAQFASMIAKAMGFDPETDEIDVETAFVDVPATHWGAKAIAFCAENGYMNGDADGNFRPDANITRQEVASVLVNTFKLTNEGTKDFPDDALIASWSKPANVVPLGII